MNTKLFKNVRKLKATVETTDSHEVSTYKFKFKFVEYTYKVVLDLENGSLEIATDVPDFMQDDVSDFLGCDLTDAKKLKIYQSFKTSRRTIKTSSANVAEYRAGEFYYKLIRTTTYDRERIEVVTNVTNETYAKLQRYLKR